MNTARVYQLRYLGSLRAPVIWCCMLVMSVVPICGQSTPIPVNEWHRRPALAATHPGTGAAERLWSIRGNNFDKDTGASYALDDPGAAAAHATTHPGAGSVEDRYFLNNPLPVRDSDAVVIATFSDYAVELSPSKHSIYTVTHFAVERVLKSKSNTVSAGDIIDSLFAGGTLNLNGRVISRNLKYGDDTPIEERQRYLLFLRYDPKSENYSIINWPRSTPVTVYIDSNLSGQPGGISCGFRAKAKGIPGGT